MYNLFKCTTKNNVLMFVVYRLINYSIDFDKWFAYLGRISSCSETRILIYMEIEVY